MKITDWINGKTLNIETLEIEERDNVVILPAWQFALFVRRYRDRTASMITWFLLSIVLVIVLFFQIGLFVF